MIKDYQIKAWQFKLETTYTEGDIPEEIGTFFWDTANHTFSVILENGVKLQNGQELHIYGKNTSGVAITNGMAVSLTSNPAQFATFEKTDITNISSARSFIGLATQDIDINAFGYITIFGQVRDIPTIGLTEKERVFVSSTPGVLSASLPTAPNTCIVVGVCERVHASQGRININSQIVPRLQDLSDVNGTPLTTTGQIPVWNNTGKYFDFTVNINDIVTDIGNKPDSYLELSDTSDTTYTGKDKYVPSVNEATGNLDLTETISATFLNLDDTPDSYSSQASKIVKVKSTEDGLEFSASSESAASIGALIGGADDATPNDTDYVATALTSGGILKKITWTNVKAFLKTYFDGEYMTQQKMEGII